MITAERTDPAPIAPNRTVSRTIRLTVTENQLLARAAAERELTLSDFIREMLSRELPRQAA
jgi:uncharacterized protein (DUF1778 family)